MSDDNTISSAYESANLDRGELTVSGRKKKNKAVIVIALVLLSLVVVAVGVLFAINQFREAEVETKPLQPESTAEVVGVEKGTVGNDSAWFEKAKRDHEKDKAQQERAAQWKREQELKQAKAQATHQQPVTVPKTGVPEPNVAKQSSTTSKRDKNAPPTPQERRLMGGLMVNVESGNAASSQSPSEPASYDNSYDAPTFAMGHASKRKQGGLDFLLKHGSIIPCALYSQVISDYQGIVMCRVTQDVYSANGKALLVERGSLLTGSQNVQLEAGKNRVFTTWADIETPNGIAIRIDSLGAGRLGASGNEAWVDNHFKERFGGAILLSFLDDAFSALAEKAASSDGDITFDSSTENASNMAEKALESSINISPTGYTQIGQRINIIVARDIDMSSVYAFE
ncbi:type IV secretion system protein VirB10 [Vibrio parahaemolyticus]|uniref:type IV secretion system protein VirB10 n=1 Tax=Vibrio parahaemolyticus TaxID=670 RepID=UPI00215C40C9|nr:type IV secretion system protein VirB10 [Vibrio parahaemolyticus]MCR9646196.1 type IV secretion system protein VirB10 [Vibrio parahaemolyticus]MCR9797578.1 type IV secretion system protein VirB10 [Vibrio parahaemolyticus]MDF4314083.1 type IV secretion system protein VirB10 [Vibrio parahaemolyticus]